MSTEYIDRRDLMRAIALATSAGLAGVPANALAQQSLISPESTQSKPPFHVGMLIFERITNLDFAGPNQVLHAIPGGKIHVLGKTLDPVTTDTGHQIKAGMLLKDAPELDMIFVPGGPGTLALMDDPEVLDFLASRAPRAKWITSVCTGSLVLGAAGLLRGYKAATHWTSMEALPALGAEPVHERVVIDRNRITGGGVTAGIDFGFVVLAHIWGREVAERVQLLLEYDPQPPFNSGSPKTARPELVAAVRNQVKDLIDKRIATSERVAKRFPAML